jgi:hypothetical protein
MDPFNVIRILPTVYNFMYKTPANLATTAHKFEYGTRVSKHVKQI